MSRHLGSLAIVFALSGSIAPHAAGAQDPGPAVPTSSREWSQARPLESLEAALLVEQVRAEQPLNASSELHATLTNFAFWISADPPGLEPPWGRPDPVCTPAGCEVLRSGLTGSPSPGDEFAFVVQWAMDPVTWSDSLLVRSDSASPVFAQAREIALAALAPAGTSPHALPGPDASWQEWRDWPGTFGSDRRAHYKIDLARTLTGRDVRSDIARQYREATSDSARLVLGFRALRLNVVDVSLEDVLRDLASPSPAIRHLGLYELEKLRPNATPADPAVATELQSRALSVVLDGAEPWPNHALATPAHPAQTLRPGNRRSDDQTNVVVATDDLPADILRLWAAEPGVSLMSNAQIDAFDDPNAQIDAFDDPARTLRWTTVGAVTVFGPFAWFSIESASRAPPSQRNTPFFGFTATYYQLTLMRVDQEWQVLETTVLVAN